MAFEEVETRFGELFRVIQTALRDITAVCDQLKATSQTQFNISEAVASFYGEGNRVPLIDNFRTAQRIIFVQHWNAFVSECFRLFVSLDQISIGIKIKFNILRPFRMHMSYNTYEIPSQPFAMLASDPKDSQSRDGISCSTRTLQENV